MAEKRRAPLLAGLLIAAFLLPEPTSAQPADAQGEFLRALTALHEFEYEEASDGFRRAQNLDPGLALAYWGEAMTYHQSLWQHENVDAARRVLSRLAPTPATRAAKCRTAKERGLLAAVETLFGPGDTVSRRRTYADAMAALHEQYPDDADIAAFYGLSLLATMARGLIGSAEVHEGRSQDLAGSETQARVAAILEKVLTADPEHRGALHYLLHTYDDPEHAARALSAARRYAKVAEASHARHMPAHIFLQLGLWDEAAASDRAAYDASVQWVARKGLGAALRNVHALSWLEYELLQLGRAPDAEEALRTIEPIAKSGNTILLNDFASMRARFVVETERWQLMAAEQNFVNVNDLFAVGLSVAHLGRRADAERVRNLLAQRARAAEEGDLRPAIAIMERELAAMLAYLDGKRDEAIATMTSAARDELDLPPPVGLPQPIKPAPEMLGEMLVDAGRPGEAIEWFERTLRRHANRSRSVAGLARARAALSPPVVPDKRMASRGPALALGALAVVAAGAALMMWRRRRAVSEKKGPAPAKGAGRKRSTKQKPQKR